MCFLYRFLVRGERFPYGAVLNEGRKGKGRPDDLPMPFPAKHWRSLIFEDGQPKRRVYETAVIATLRDRLRVGDVWVEGSRDYRRFDSYLMPRDKAEPVLKDAGFETGFDTWVEGCRKRMTERLDHVDAALKHDRLSSVRIERGCLKITPHDAVTPAAALRLDRAIDAVMPRIRITELLWEVNARTGFLDAFVDLRSGGKHPEPTAILAAILAGAVNLGLERMAYASTRLTHTQLIWAQTWYLRSETCSDALARIIDAHHDLPFAQNWGEAERTSSDG